MKSSEPRAVKGASLRIEGKRTVRSLGATGRIRTILVPTDFSAPALKALMYAGALGKKFRAKLHLVHVDDVGIDDPMVGSFYGLDAEIGKKLGQRLQRIAAECATPVPASRCHVRIGRAYYQVCREARKLKADLIITSTHGFTGLKRVLMGSTAERIVRYAPCPVLIVREHERDFVRVQSGVAGEFSLELKKILVPVDFSVHSDHALRYAIGWARRLGASVAVLHIVRPQYFAAMDAYAACNLAAIMDALRESAETQMRELVRQTPWAGVPFQAKVMVGLPGRVIGEFAAGIEADLIVTSTHGRTGLKHVLMGSVAEQVVRYSRSAVLVVPRVKS
jgi:nucleotide-binding universal stress UspA family protein